MGSHPILFDGLHLERKNDISVFRNIIHEDSRGFLREWTNSAILSHLNNFKAAQINISESRKNVLRGLHAVKESDSCQKLVTCVYGEIVDVVLDIRKSSNNFGNFEIFHLNSSEGKSVFVPHGFAHGFFVKSELAVVVYQLDKTYKSGNEICIDALDKDISIPWGDISNVIRSEKDANAKKFKEIVSVGNWNG